MLRHVVAVWGVLYLFLGFFEIAKKAHKLGLLRPLPLQIIMKIQFFTPVLESTHTGIVEKVENGTVYTIEGNTSDQVARRIYSLSDGSILGYGRPAYDSVTAGNAPAAAVESVSTGPKEILVSVPFRS